MAVKKDANGTEIQANFSKGMIRDVARVAIPEGAVYNSADFLLDQPGVARKRGGTSYAGPALTGASFVVALLHVPFSAGSQLLAVGSNSHLFKVTSGTTTDIGALNAASVSYEKWTISPGAKYAINTDGSTQAQKYDGSTITQLANAGLTMGHSATYKSRIVGSGRSGFENRLFFSGTPDVNSSWDLSNSFIDADNQVSGLAALNNALLIFSGNGLERIIGATPPPNSDMDRAPVSPIGCTDCRSIVQDGPYVYFANPQGVYLTNGSTPVSLTEQGGIDTYWRSLFTGYIAATPIPSSSTWTIAAGYWRGFLFVSVLNDSRVLQATLMCDVSRRAWWRLSNIKAMCYATSVDGNELYYGNADTNRVTAMSGIFSPTSSNKNDADGTAVTPSIEFAPVGRGSAVKSYGFGRLTYDMRDSSSDNPTLAVAVKTGIEADASATPSESPLAETSTADRKRFSIAKDSQAVTISLTQSNASSKTEIYALEADVRSHPISKDGV